MKHSGVYRAILLSLILLYCKTIFCSSVQFNVVYPQSDVTFLNLNVAIRIDSVAIGSFTMTTDKNITYSYTYEVTTDPLTQLFEYQYEAVYTTELKVEGFWRTLTTERLRSDSQPLEGIFITLNEYYGQEQNYLGLEPVPHLVNTINPPEYFDDNQVMTVNFEVSQIDLDFFLMRPEDDGKTYVKANLNFISLEKNEYYDDVKIRRAGGQSLHVYPYSYQIKIEIKGKADEVIKFKSYGVDYEDNSARIIAEKAASDICIAVGAPINYVSYVRFFINGVDYGLYAMLEKVDNQFIERRWPYIELTSDAVGTLYKTQSSDWCLLNNEGWKEGIPEYCETMYTSAPVCCPCYDNNCDVNDDCDNINDDQNVCQSLTCCDCSWQRQGTVEAETANCLTQQPFADFILLGEAILTYDNFPLISSILNVNGYLQSLICEMATMNSDGYVFNGKNYYWYRDSVTGLFNLVLYDQDISFTRKNFIDLDWNPWTWTYVGDLSDALFLPTLLKDEATLAQYNALLNAFIEQFYRPDRTGPLYQRMDTFANYVITYNPQRKEIAYKTNGFIDWFILPLSAIVQEQLSYFQPGNATLPKSK